MPTRGRLSNALERPIAEIKADLFKALAHPGRIRILEVLASGERT
ncbi:MAG: transcriptional regulator, partial [Actinomycetota bacterium]